MPKLSFSEADFEQVKIEKVQTESADYCRPSDQVADMTESHISDDLQRSLIPVNTSLMTEEGNRRNRQDSAVILQHEPLRSVILNPINGLLPDFVDSQGQLLGDFQKEKSYIINALRFQKLSPPMDPLFQSFELLKEHLPYARLSKEARGQKAY